MTDILLADLLEKLHAGDAGAANELFQRYEPYLRMVVRRKISPALRAKFDSEDVVQSVWADMFRGFQRANWEFNTPSQLKAFLVRAVTNRFIDKVRRNRNELAHQENGIPVEELPQSVTRPSEEAQAGEMWDELLNLCRSEHRMLIELKRQGISLDEIAERSGLHKSSVRRILYDLARRFQEKNRPAAG